MSTHLLCPRIAGAMVYRSRPEESTCEGNAADRAAIHTHKFGLVLHAMMALNKAIFDIAAEDTESFFCSLRHFSGSAEHFDFFLIPVLTDQVAIDGAFKTFDALVRLGVPQRRMRFVMTSSSGSASMHAPLPRHIPAKLSAFLPFLRAAPVLLRHQVIFLADTLGVTLDELAELFVQTDDRAAHFLSSSVQHEHPKEGIQILDGVVNARMDLDRVFRQLFPEVAIDREII